MNAVKRAGIIAITIGFALAVFSSATYFQEENEVDLGRLEQRKGLHDPEISPLIGMGIMAAGAFLIWRDRYLRKKAGRSIQSKKT